MVAVVCDGVGAYRRSHEAAALVSRSLAQSAAGGSSWTGAFAAANELLVSYVEPDRRPDGGREMATTAVGLRVERVLAAGSDAEYVRRLRELCEDVLITWVVPDRVHTLMPAGYRPETRPCSPITKRSPTRSSDA